MPGAGGHHNPVMQDNNKPAAIFLMGPTAMGKTELAMTLHERFPVDLINVDSSQVYRGMDIGTAKPSKEELARVPHRLIDIRDPAESYSVADFCDDAVREMQQITASGRIPLLVGGTMFYFHALEHGLAELPAADEAVRQQLLEQAEELGWPAMHARLAEIDPEMAERLQPNDKQRVQRALEIFEITGQAASSLQQDKKSKLQDYNLVKIAICPDNREKLHRRIETRFQQMLQQGLLEEVEKLFKRGDLGPDRPSMRTVGYRQVWQYLSQSIDYTEMEQRGVIATRQLAKRQMTWIRGYQDLHRLEGEISGLIDPAIEYLQDRLQIKG